jgi:hypothetical protein
MSFRRLVTTLTFLAIFTMAVRVSIDTDTWWHLGAGQWIVEHRQILTTDPFSLTRQGQPWVYPGWLAQVGLYSTYAAFGFRGLIVLTALMVTLAFAFVWRASAGPALLKAFLFLLAAAASGVYWSARPQILSFALAGAFLLILEGSRAGSRRWLVALPILMALWVNLHGGFAIGFLLLAVYIGGECLDAVLAGALNHGGWREAWGARWPVVRDLLLASAACLVTAGANPAGFGMLAYPFKTVSIGVLQDYIQEWQSPNFHHLETLPFLWLLLVALVVLASSRLRRHPTEVLLVCVFAYLGMLAGRNIALFALVVLPGLTRHGASIAQALTSAKAAGRQVPQRLARGINVGILAILIVAAVVKISLPLSMSKIDEAIRAQAPVDAVRYLEQNRPAGALFNSYNWGGYILWSLYPEYLTFVDGRTDLFDNDLLQSYLAAWRGDRSYLALFSRWGIRIVLIETDAPLGRVLREAGWKLVYSDDQAVVMAMP